MADTAAPTAIPSADSTAEMGNAFREDREAQFLELVNALPPGENEGDEAVESAPSAEAPTAEEAAPAEEPAPVESTAIVEEPDPLATAKPFSYTVDGAPKAYDGIRVLIDKDGKEQGGIIPAEAMQAVRDAFQRRDFLEAQDKARWEKMREYEAITFKQGDVEHKGLAAVEQYATENAKLSAAVKVLADTIETPDKLIALAYAVQNGDTTELNRLTREIGLVAKEASWKAKESWGQAQRQTVERSTQEQERSQITSQAISGAVQHWAQQHPALTKDDVEKAVQHFSRVGTSIVRPATPDEAKAAGVKPGELVIDHPVIYEWLKDRADLRAQQAEASAKATAAATENAKKLAAAARGKPAPKQKAVPSDKAPAPKSKAEEWQEQRLRMLGGQFSQADAE